MGCVCPGLLWLGLFGCVGKPFGQPNLSGERDSKTLLATGPRTPEGKAVSSRNAIRHGVLSCLEVLPEVERVEDWIAHRDAVLEDLAPSGYVEEWPGDFETTV